MPMTGTYLVQEGIPLPIWRTEKTKRRNLVGSVEELYNEIEKSIAAVFKRKSFQRF
jgi:isoleucyl-tRNA synthetase